MTPRIDLISSFGKEERQELLAQAEFIFFETARVKSFDSDKERENFRWRWFGRYAEIHPSAFFVARSPDGSVIGYLAGCIDTFADENRELVADVDYYTPAFASTLTGYPSHLHINIAPHRQNQGIGKTLMDRFHKACQRAGSSGVHVVTSASPRPWRFTKLADTRESIFPRLRQPAGHSTASHKDLALYVLLSFWQAKREATLFKDLIDCILKFAGIFQIKRTKQIAGIWETG